MQPEPTLPGVLPTARVELEVLLGPGGELDQIAVRVEDPDGRLLALRRWPIGPKDSPTGKLDASWRALLQALPLQAFDRNYDPGRRQRGNKADK